MRHRRGPAKTKGGKALMILVCVAAFISLFSYIVMALWNAILPDVLHVSTINFWQAMGILVLSKILFGGFGGWGGKKHEWKRKMEEKFKDMSPEEREQFRANMRNRFANRWCGPSFGNQEKKQDFFNRKEEPKKEDSQPNGNTNA